MGFDVFYLSTSALPRLSLFVLTVGIMLFVLARAGRRGGGGWLALALAGFALHHAAFVGFEGQTSGAVWGVLTGLSWSSVFLAAWALIGAVSRLVDPAQHAGARRRLVLFGALAIAGAVFIHLAYGPLAGRVPFLVSQGVGATVTLILGITPAVLLVRHRREIADPDRARRAFWTFAIAVGAGMAIPVAGLFRDLGLISEGLDEQVAQVMWATVMLMLVTFYVNYDPKPTSFLVKVVAFAFFAVVTTLGVASGVAFPSSALASRAAPTALQFVPEGDGYRVEPGGRLDPRLGEPTGVEANRPARVDLGFAFPFAGQTWTDLIVDDDGYVAFGPEVPGYDDLLHRTDLRVIAPFVASLDPEAVSVVRDAGRAVLTWRDVPFASGAGTATIQLALAADGTFAFRYGDLPPSTNWTRGVVWGEGPRRTLVAGETVGAGAVTESPYRDRLEADARRAQPYAWLIVGAGLFVLVAFPLYLRDGLTRPLRRLLDGVRRAERGEPADVPVGARDEIGVLTETFNRMSRDLRAYADELEARVERRTAELEASLAELRATQARLVQQEKMASLGQLTAGIAHEIKNPLNFVTNFADLSTELVDDLATEADPDERAALLADLRQNAEKIAEHGRRADAIVRGMMAHARTAGGDLETVDLDALVAEYAALAYHGMRARHPEAVVAFEQDLGGVGAVEAIPGDLGRVVINLLDNAFDAVRNHSGRVVVSTCRANGRAEIRVEDDGPGIPEADRERIFEPFFTTKPTGEGTGLGLSLAYDIVAQGHGGTLTVESPASEADAASGTAFVVSLPAGDSPP
ncbi:MAG: ATP-binding protein [Bacteroidota bacterium]